MTKLFTRVAVVTLSQPASDSSCAAKLVEEPQPPLPDWSSVIEPPLTILLLALFKSVSVRV